MPGHVKLGKPGEPDPDPSPYLIISMDMKRQDMLKAYDPKKSYWVPDGQGGYVEGLLESDDGKKAVVACGHEVGKLISYNLLLMLHIVICIALTNFRKRPSSLKTLARSTLPSLRSARTWPT